MSVEVKIPTLGFSESDATLSEWHVGDGEAVSVGQLLYSYESEKAVQEVEAPVAGIVEQVAKVGETYSAGTVIARIKPGPAGQS